jgi:drug/metabolite transporter (DMT)-like permease
LKKLLPYISLLAAILALSLSSLFVRWSAASGPVTSFYRMALASIFMFPFVQRHKQKESQPIRGWIKWLPFALVGGMFIALDHYTWSLSINLTKVANATFLNNMAPLWVAMFAALVWKEKLFKSFWFGLALTLTGAGLILGVDLLYKPQLSSGDFIALFSSLFYGGYFLTTQLGRSKVDTLPYVWSVTTISAFVLFFLNLATHQPTSGFPTTTYLIFLGSALISQTIGYFSVGYALGHLPASVVSPTMIGQPMLTALLAIPLAGEPLTLDMAAGGLLVLTGIFLVNRNKSSRTSETASAA